jgi:metallo-beta-lactamase family protein
MKITVHGAGGGEVTGSAYLVQTKNATVLVDCGLFQGRKKLENYNRLPGKGAVASLDAVVLTHAHLDHTGRLPLLTRVNYNRPIYATPATIEITGLLLRDSSHLQKSDVERENRKRKRQGKPPLELLYSLEEVEALSPLYCPLEYDHPTEIAPGIAVRVVESGHIAGSASIEMTVEENGVRKVVVFSGDLGPRGAPLHQDPVPFKHADIVFMETTYGSRDHRSLKETAIEAREAIRKTIEANGKVLVPVFAVGRVQLLLYLLAGAFERKTLSPFPIYIDSPMAIEATRIYGRHTEVFDEEALAMQQSGDLRKNLETVQFSATAKESQALNDLEGPLMIMAGAGMCTGGRILHHLRHNLGQPENTVLFVGYQSPGSLGRQLVDGQEKVRIFDEMIPVKASVHTLGGLSGHAGQSDLINWFDSLAPVRPRLILTHGEDNEREAFGSLIQERYRITPEYPKIGDVIDTDGF